MNFRRINNGKYFIINFILFFSLTFYQSCSDLPVLNLFSDADEVSLGREVDLEIANNPNEYPIFTGDPTVRAYLKDNIFNHILSSSQVLKRNVYDYRIEIIQRDDVLNAFALPGGSIYVYTGLLKYLDSEAALAGVIGHEIAHIEKRHATNRISAHYGVTFLISLVLGENPSAIAEIAANLFVGLTFLANSRSDESQSDEFSFKYLQDSRYYPGAVKFFFEKLRDDGLINSNASGIETFLSTHPDPIARITQTDQLLNNAGIEVRSWTNTGSGMFRNEYLQNIVNKLP